MSTEITGKTSDFLKIGVAAAGRGDLEAVEKILEERPEWLNRVGSHGRTMLWEAAFRGRLVVVRELLRRGADPDAWGCHFTPLLVEVSPYVAARFKAHDEVAALFAPDELDVFSAAFLADVETLDQRILDDPSVVTRTRPQHDPNVVATALHYAVAGRSLEAVDRFLAAGADPTPYMNWLSRFAIWRDESVILDRLLTAGAAAIGDVEIPRSGIRSEAVRGVLDRHGVSVDPDRAEGGWPPLVFASRGDRGGDVAKVRALLAEGADVDVRNAKRQTALHCAAKAGFVEIVEVLLEAGATVDSEDNAGETPLATAIASSIKDKDALASVVRLLVSAGADPDRALAKGGTPRRRAARKRDGGLLLDALEG